MPISSSVIAPDGYSVRRHRPGGFPFTDLSAVKRRPALVISRDNERRPDIVVAYISSVMREEPDAMSIQPSRGNGLKGPSLVRFDKVATLEQRIVAGRLGSADPAWLERCRAVFFGVFGFGVPDR
jgi:mRNA interferase MazF